MSLASVIAKIKNHPLGKGWAGKAAYDVGEAANTADAAIMTYVDAQVTTKFIGSDDALTVDNDGNVAGLASAIVLADSLKATMNLHYADQGASGEEHKAVTTGTAIANDDATDLASILALTGEMLTSYAAHDDDAIIGSPVDHQAQGTEKALTSAVTPTTLLEAMTRLIDLKAKLNDHMDDATAHTAGDSAQEAADDAAAGAVVNIPVSGALTNDKVVWGILDSGTGTVTGVSAVAGTNTVVVTFSADPQADTIISYLVVRSV
jgi:hypothetical protein